MYEELKKRLAICVNLLANEEGDNVVEAIAAIETLEANLEIRDAFIVNKGLFMEFVETIPQGHDAIDLSKTMSLEAQLATANARIEELKEALGDICKDSNPDWVEKRVYPNDILDDIHSVAVEAYYSKKHMNKQSR